MDCNKYSTVILFQAYRDLIGFIVAMSDAVKNKKLRDEYHISPVSIDHSHPFALLRTIGRECGLISTDVIIKAIYIYIRGRDNI